MVSRDVQLLKKQLETAFTDAKYFKSGPQRYSLMINSDTEIFVYPGVRSNRTHVYLDTLVGLENTTLKNRLKNFDDKSVKPRVCQTLLYAIDGVRELWDGLAQMYVEKGKPTSQVVVLLFQALEKFAIPLLRKYDSKEKVVELLAHYSKGWRNSEGWRNHGGFIIFDAEIKLSLLTDH